MAKHQNKEKLNKSARFTRVLASISVILCLIIVLGYGSSPFIIERVIRSYLPDNIILTDFNSDFPGLTQFTIEDLELDVDGNQVYLSDVVVDYNLRDISLEHLSVMLEDGEEKSDELSGLFTKKLLILPKIDLAGSVFLDNLEYISIHRIDILRKNQRTSFNNTQFQKINKNDIRITSDNIAVDNLNIETSNSIEVIISTDNPSRLDLRLSSNNLQIAKLSYFNQAEKYKLELQFSNLFLLNELGLLSMRAPFSKQSILNLVWSSNLSTNQSVVELKAHLNPSKTMLDWLGIESSLGDKDTFPILTEIKLIANKDEAITLKGFIESNSPIELTFDSTLLNILGARLSFDTSVNEELSSINNILLLAPKSQFDIDGLSVNLPDGLRVDLKKLVLKSTGEQIHLYANRKQEANSDIFALLGNEFSLNNTLEVEHITGSYSPMESDINESVNFSSKLISDFDISKKQDKVINTSGRLSLDNLVMEKLDDFIDSKLSLSWEQIDKSLSSGSAQLLLTSENAAIAGVGIERLSSDAKFLFEADKIIGIGKIVLDEKIISPFNLSFNKENSNFLAQFKNDKLDSQVFNPFLSAFGQQNKLDLNILSGYTQQSTRLLINDTLAFTSSLIVEGMLFAFGENTISGLNIKQEIKSISPLEFVLDLSIEEINFTSGLLINKVKSHIASVSNETIRISDLTAEILEGILSIDTIDVKHNVMQPSVMKLSNISLTELIFFMDVAGLYAEGILDIELPLSIANSGIVVEDGIFATQKPGILKYSTTEAVSDDENIGLKALRNFHYQSLDGTLSYGEHGNYRIKLHLLGSNPDLYDGYPIDFVVNLNGELSGIFRSLFLTGNFEEAIMEQVKTGQVDKNPE